MRAAIFKGPGLPLAFAIEERPDPRPGTGQAVLKVGRCGVCGTDLHMTSGHGLMHPRDVGLGHEFAGEVVALGSEVQTLKVGDLVTALPVHACGKCAACLLGDPMRCPERLSASKGFAEYVLVDERCSVKLPVNVSVTDGALTEPLCVSLRGVRKANMQPGARVLVVGVGPIGLAAIFWARRLGAGRIVAIARSRRAEDLARVMGVSTFLLPQANPADEIAEALGGPPDIVFECAGVEGVIAQCVEWVRPGGTLIVLGFCTTSDTFLPATAVMKEVDMRFVFVYTRQDFVFCLDVLDAGHIEPRSMITKTVSLEEFPATFEALRHPTDQCKVLLDPWKR